MSQSRHDLLTEQEARQEYGLRKDRGSYYDGVSSSGVKHEIKSARRELSSGRKGSYRFWESEHHSLTISGGMYVLVAYDVDGRGIQNVSMTRRKATTLTDTLEWYESGHEHKDGERQYKLTYDKIRYR